MEADALAWGETHLGPAGLGQVHPGRWGPRGDYPSLPWLGLGPSHSRAELVPQTSVCTWGIQGRPETHPSWLGPGSLQGPHVPGLGAWGCRCPAGRRSSWVGPGACPWEGSLLCWGLNHRANRLQASQDWLHQAPDSGGVGAAPHLPVEPITSLSWRRVGAREAREQFLGLRESLAQSQQAKPVTSQGDWSGAAVAECQESGERAAPLLWEHHLRSPQGPPKDRAREGAELVRVLGAGSRVWVQSPPSLALSFLWL